MRFLSHLIKNAINDGLSKGISDAVEKAARSIIDSNTQSPAEKTEAHTDTAAAMSEDQQAEFRDAADEEEDLAIEGFNGDFSNFPVWDYTVVEELSKGSDTGYRSIILTAKLTDTLIEKYQSRLAAKGFSGDWQIMSKEINGKKLIVDFTFVPDSQIQYIVK